jgi:hypothetical protein
MMPTKRSITDIIADTKRLSDRYPNLELCRGDRKGLYFMSRAEKYSGEWQYLWVPIETGLGEAGTKNWIG